LSANRCRGELELVRERQRGKKRKRNRISFNNGVERNPISPPKNLMEGEELRAEGGMETWKEGTHPRPGGRGQWTRYGGSSSARAGKMRNHVSLSFILRSQNRGKTAGVGHARWGKYSRKNAKK